MPSPTGDRTLRLRMARAASGVALFASIAAGGSVILVSQSGAQEETITTDTKVAEQLVVVETGEPVETFLLVGSDTREGADPNSEDYGSIGDENVTTGRRSDTVMILRHNKETGEAALLSLPRDLWVKVPGLKGKSRLNAAYTLGTDVLVKTIKSEIGVTINHYIEVDFTGFKTLVDAVQGVEACFFFPTRDKNTGLLVGQKGCWDLDGVQALAYTRSRHFQEFKDGDWREDKRSDLGRIVRQQQFIVDAVKRAEERLAANPFALDELVKAAGEALVVDPGVDLFSLAHRFRDLSPANVITYTLPNNPKTINGNEVLEIDTKKAKPILDYFNNLGPAPDPALFVAS
jgi:polyisoprenyl-teichoic acid--peptidoglycan teichoic acid transferase